MEKLTEKISEDVSESEEVIEPVFVREETVGVVVTKSKGNNASFSVFGEKNDYTQTELESDSEPLLFSVSSSNLL